MHNYLESLGFQYFKKDPFSYWFLNKDTEDGTPLYRIKYMVLINYLYIENYEQSQPIKFQGEVNSIEDLNQILVFCKIIL